MSYLREEGDRLYRHIRLETGMCFLQKQVRMVTKQVQGQTVLHQIIEYMCALSSLFTCYT